MPFLKPKTLISAAVFCLFWSGLPMFFSQSDRPWYLYTEGQRPLRNRSTHEWSRNGHKTQARIQRVPPPNPTENTPNFAPQHKGIPTSLTRPCMVKTLECPSDRLLEEPTLSVVSLLCFFVAVVVRSDDGGWCTMGCFRWSVGQVVSLQRERSLTFTCTNLARDRAGVSLCVLPFVLALHVSSACHFKATSNDRRVQALGCSGHTQCPRPYCPFNIQRKTLAQLCSSLPGACIQAQEKNIVVKNRNSVRRKGRMLVPGWFRSACL